MFPEGKQLGGAPANFAYMTRLLRRRHSSPPRRSDALDALPAPLERLGVRAKHVQLDPAHPTGTVKSRGRSRRTAHLLKSPSPSPVDFFEWTPEWRSLAERADAVCFGSLAQRCPQSRATIRQFLSAVRPGATRVFDVNLRQSFYNAKTLSESASSPTS